jgi:hypothetical protein
MLCSGEIGANNNKKMLRKIFAPNKGKRMIG